MSLFEHARDPQIAVSLLRYYKPGMDRAKNLAKGGWHPKGKEGGTESWRGDFKGINTVAGWMGKSKESNSSAQDHTSTPLSTLKDPSSFGPPPKRVPGPPPTSSSSSLRSSSAASGLGSALSEGELEAQARKARDAEEAVLRRQEKEDVKVSSGPYRVDTTGLNSAGLPKPPVFRGAARVASPNLPGANKAKPPSLPPRLPPRSASQSVVAQSATPPPPLDTIQPTSSSDGYLNQGAMSRLGQSGISVPGFGIGRTASPPVPARINSTTGVSAPATSPLKKGTQLGELQARLSKMNTFAQPAATAHESQPSAAATTSTGTTWAQKQAALRAARDFKKDPTSVSLTDAREAASTANNFRERHGEQVVKGYNAANQLNVKFGVAGKLHSYSTDAGAAEQSGSSSVAATGKKPAPPPPPKKMVLTDGLPPPLPLASKPKPGA